MRKDDLQTCSPSRPGHARRQRGVSLLELMVGLVVGLICVLIIVQLQTLWDARKRTVGAGNDAQISGTLGAFALDRDLRLAGFGIGTAGGDPADPTTSVMGCNVNAVNTTLTEQNIGFKLIPVEIVRVTDKPDEIHVLYGNSSYFVSSQPIVSSTAESNSLKSREGFLIGDKAIVASTASGKVCHLVEITGLSTADPNAIEHKSGLIYTTNQGLIKTAVMNKTGGTDTDIASGVMFNLGLAPSLTVWSVDPSRQSLTRYNRLFENPVSASDVVTDVVTLKAQYGYDASGDGVIGAGEWYDTLPTGADYVHLLAVRFGLLIRSRQYERPNVESSPPVPVTASAPKWANGSIAFAMRNVDNTNDSGASAIAGEAAANNWRNYRYRVYDTVVPLRNMIWGVVP
ncbi:PilW family protein [Variovorax sp. OK605]|uniref:PilW family protein n=1 Tax=Variovorax sp. OK605 TaxID=1855317 RepID=UPI001C43115B|nr:PilW family protein [Variovorax sp. OK605]